MRVSFRRSIVALITIATLSALAVLAGGTLVACGGNKEESGGDKPAVDFAGYWRAVGDDDPSVKVPYIIKIERVGGGYEVIDYAGQGEEPLTGKLAESALDVDLTIGHERFTIGEDPDRFTLDVFPATGPEEPIFSHEFERLTDGEQAWKAGLAAWKASSVAATDEAVKDAVGWLQKGLSEWAKYNDGTYPPASAVRPDGELRGYMAGWPKNHFTYEPMRPSNAKGDYTYTSDGTSYTLVGHLSDGQEFTVSGK